jgi:hypothetical protein
MSGFGIQVVGILSAIQPPDNKIPVEQLRCRRQKSVMRGWCNHAHLNMSTKSLTEDGNMGAASSYGARSTSSTCHLIRVLLDLSRHSFHIAVLQNPIIIFPPALSHQRAWDIWGRYCTAHFIRGQSRCVLLLVKSRAVSLRKKMRQQQPRRGVKLWLSALNWSALHLSSWRRAVGESADDDSWWRAGDTIAQWIVNLWDVWWRNDHHLVICDMHMTVCTVLCCSYCNYGRTGQDMQYMHSMENIICTVPPSFVSYHYYFARNSQVR